MKKFMLPVILLILSCISNAPHTNPYDPANPDAIGKIKGNVCTLFNSNPIEGATVELFPTQRKDTTDGSGNFSFPDLNPDIYIVTANKDFYIEKSCTTEIKGGKEKELQFKLNGKPTIRNCFIYSELENRTYPNPDSTFKVIFTLQLFDPDPIPGDSVLAESDKEKIILIYESGDTLRLYKKVKYYNNIYSIDTLIGVDFHFWVRDVGGLYSDTITTNLKRTICKFSNILFPDSGETLSIGDTLKWVPPLLGFEHFTVLRFWQNSENPVWVSDTLPGEDSTYIFTESSIEPGIFDWAVEILDRFRNSSRTITRLYLN